MNVLVVGGTGTVGSQVVNELLKRNAHVTVMTHLKNKISTVPIGAIGVFGDLDKPSTLTSVFEGHDSMFLVTPTKKNEIAQGRAAINAAKKAGIKHITYLSVHNLEQCQDIPHFKTKISIEKAIKDSGITFTILRANHFFQNDLSLKDMILHKNVYTQPLGDVGLNLVDVRDIAEAAANSFLEKGHANKIYPLVGPNSLTGKSIGKIYSRYTGHEVRYTGNDLNNWTEATKRVMPSEVVDSLTKMYKHYQNEGLLATNKDMEMEKQILGHEPRSFDSFVSEMMSPLHT